MSHQTASDDAWKGQFLARCSGGQKSPLSGQDGQLAGQERPEMPIYRPSCQSSAASKAFQAEIGHFQGILPRKQRKTRHFRPHFSSQNKAFQAKFAFFKAILGIKHAGNSSFWTPSLSEATFWTGGPGPKTQGGVGTLENPASDDMWKGQFLTWPDKPTYWIRWPACRGRNGQKCPFTGHLAGQAMQTRHFRPKLAISRAFCSENSAKQDISGRNWHFQGILLQKQSKQGISGQICHFPGHLAVKRGKTRHFRPKMAIFQGILPVRHGKTRHFGPKRPPGGPKSGGFRVLPIL